METQSTHEYEEEAYEEPTAHDEQIIEEMNVTNMQHDPETENKESHTDEYTESLQNTQAGNTANHGYNLWPRPTKRHDRLNLMQVAQQSTCADNVKPHLHVLMTQMSVKADSKKFRKKAMTQCQKNCNNYMTERQWCQ